MIIKEITWNWHQTANNMQSEEAYNFASIIPNEKCHLKFRVKRIEAIKDERGVFIQATIHYLDGRKKVIKNINTIEFIPEEN
jgi:hypothetical protein